MSMNYKLFFKYILFNIPQLFLNYLNKNYINTIIVIPNKTFYYLILHLKLSSLITTIQLIDIFAYELPYMLNYKQTTNNNVANTNMSTIVYNFHSFNFQQRFFIFALTTNQANVSKYLTNDNTNTINSITELFLNASWLERETAELHGIFFAYKKDLRNLMLPYNDTSAPLQKSLPSIGLKELSYDALNDTIIHTPVTIQF